MTQRGRPTPVRERAFLAALCAFPPLFRSRFTDSMLDAFAHAYDEHRLGGRGRASLFVLQTIADVVASGLSERLRPSLDQAPSIRFPTRRNSRVTASLGWIGKEIHFAIRSLGRSPGFAGIAVLTLALGIGANTAIFSVVNGVLLRPLAYPEPDRLVAVSAEWGGSEVATGGMSYPDLADLERVSPSIERVSGWDNTSMTLTGHGDPVVLRVTRVTTGLLDVFGVAPLLGRDIRSEEFGPSAPAVVVIGHGFWQGRFGGRADVLGRTVYLNSVSYAIVGVAPPGFEFPTSAELWIPRQMDLEECGRGCHSMRGVGRLASGASMESVVAEAEFIAANLREAYPDTNTTKAFRVEPLKESMVSDVRAGLLLLLGAVGLVVLIACANVANLLLVRASARTSEIAIRTAIGASRMRLIGQSLVESSLLAIAGGALGLGFAGLALRLLSLFGTAIPRTDSVVLDQTVLSFTATLIVVVTLLFGLAPAFVLVRSSVHAGLGSRSRGAGDGRDRQRFRRVLLAVEVGLSAILLVGAGLLLRSFVELYRVDLGFDTQNITRFSVVLPETRYESLDEIRSFYRELEQRIAELPGVESVASVWGAPLGRVHAYGTVLVSGRPEPASENEIDGAIHSVGPGYLEMMRIPLLKGRGLTREDDRGPSAVALVNQAFVDTVFPHEEPVGRRFRVTVDLGFGHPEWTIVGVVGNVRSRALDRDPVPEIYVPQGVYGPENMTVMVRSLLGASVSLPAIRAILERKDADVPIYRVETLDEAMARHVAPTRFYLVLIAVFAALAAVLAAVGLYGVVAYNASRRTHEIGLRVALGAQQGRILAMVVREGVWPAIIGLAFGLVIAYGSGRIVDAILFRISPRDPWTFATTGSLLLIISVVAALFPALRASRVDPAHALRVE